MKPQTKQETVNQLLHQLWQEKEDAIRKVLTEAGADLTDTASLQRDGYMRQQQLAPDDFRIVETFFYKGKPMVRFGPLVIEKVPQDTGGFRTVASRSVEYLQEQPAGSEEVAP